MAKYRSLIEDFYRGWENEDWEAVSSRMKEDVRFRSPLDDFVGVAEYKKRCWPLSPNLKEFRILDYFEDGDRAMIRYELEGKDGVGLRGAEHYRFEHGKIGEVDGFWYKR